MTNRRFDYTFHLSRLHFPFVNFLNFDSILYSILNTHIYLTCKCSCRPLKFPRLPYFLVTMVWFSKIIHHHSYYALVTAKWFQEHTDEFQVWHWHIYAIVQVYDMLQTSLKSLHNKYTIAPKPHRLHTMLGSPNYSCK